LSRVTSLSQGFRDVQCHGWGQFYINNYTFAKAINVEVDFILKALAVWLCAVLLWPMLTKLLVSRIYTVERFFLFRGVEWGWVHLVRWPLIGVLNRPRIVDGYGAFDGMRIGRGNRSTRRKPTPVALCPPQIPHELTWGRTLAAEVGSRRLIAWARHGPPSNFRTKDECWIGKDSKGSICLVRSESGESRPRLEPSTSRIPPRQPALWGSLRRFFDISFQF
jgi:hypothetical protein